MRSTTDGRLWSKPVVSHVFFSVMCAAAMFLPQTLVSHDEWKHYTNHRWNFCVDTPRRWSWDEGFDGAGIFAYPPQKARGTDRSGVEIGARYDQPSERNPRRMQTLDEIFSGRPDVLGGVQNLELAEKKRITFRNSSAIYARMNYQLHGERWVAEDISFLTPQGLVYLLEMRCGRKEFGGFHKVFRRMAFQTFRLRCK